MTTFMKATSVGLARPATRQSPGAHKRLGAHRPKKFLCSFRNSQFAIRIFRVGLARVGRVGIPTLESEIRARGPAKNPEWADPIYYKCIFLKTLQGPSGPRIV